jgi:hypothetical protein
MTDPTGGAKAEAKAPIREFGVGGREQPGTVGKLSANVAGQPLDRHVARALLDGACVLLDEARDVIGRSV